MKLRDLAFETELSLGSPSLLHRVQSKRARAGATVIGALRLPPAGLLKGHFDLTDQVVGYFGETPEAAVYETLARREALQMRLSGIAKLQMVIVRTSSRLSLLDLRPHATAFPVLQSLRYGQTQELARDAAAAGYDGMVYLSAHQHGAQCYALFERALPQLRLERRCDLVQAGTDALHGSVIAALRGSRLPLDP